LPFIVISKQRGPHPSYQEQHPTCPQNNQGTQPSSPSVRRLFVTNRCCTPCASDIGCLELNSHKHRTISRAGCCGCDADRLATNH
jgi:hypothetical protein